MARHPHLVIENCCSGAQRMDYAMLSLHQLQSTSDQEDAVLYAYISASAPTVVTPEQSASWAYLQPGWDDEKNVLTVVNTLLGRVHLSGRVDALSRGQRELVREGKTGLSGFEGGVGGGDAALAFGVPVWGQE
jgi:alpha-galactosidase